MIKKTVTYTDYNGIERKENCYFNITKSEALEMQFESGGNLTDILQKMIDEKDQVKLGRMFKDLIVKTYGIKSDDGKRFIKSKEISEAFEQSPAYDEIYMDLLTHEDHAIAFVKGILPADIAKEIAEQELANKKKAIPEEQAQIVRLEDIKKDES